LGGIPLGHTIVPAEHLLVPAIGTAKLARAVITAHESHQTNKAADADAFSGRFDADKTTYDPQSSFDWEDVRSDLRRRAERFASGAVRNPLLTASVVICTRDRPELLSRCLASLCEQTFKPVEIIVVDNAPQSDLTRRLVEQTPDVRYVPERRPGLDVARNTGIRLRQGNVIAFIGDDVVAHLAWLKRLLAGFSCPTILAVTGLVLPLELETEVQLLFERYWSFNGGYEPIVFGGAFFETKH
jgi:Glycosyl transferase family 2